MWKNCGIHPPFHGIHAPKVWNPSPHSMESIHHSMESTWNFCSPSPLPWIPHGITWGGYSTDFSLKGHHFSFTMRWWASHLPSCFSFFIQRMGGPLFGSTLPSSMSSAGFCWIPMECWNSREFPWKFQNDSYGFPVEFEWNSCGFLVEFQGNSMEIPLKFQNDSKWNLNGMPTTSYGISLNLKSGLFKKLGKSMCINQ